MISYLSYLSNLSNLILINPIKKLLTYRYAEILQDLTVEFVKRYISKFSRTKDQMEQAARSGKQNIVEGVGQSQTSLKGLIKLLGVAKGSIEELQSDCEDFLRQNGLEIYAKDDPRVAKFKQIAYRLTSLDNLDSSGQLIEKPVLPDNPQDAANFLLTLCHISTYLLHKQIESAKKKFVSEGGFSENLFRERIKNRNK